MNEYAHADTLMHPLAQSPFMMASASGDGDGAAASGSTFSALELEKVRQLLEEFATERDWDQYHTPRNIVLAMTGEVGELAELFQYD